MKKILLALFLTLFAQAAIAQQPMVVVDGTGDAGQANVSSGALHTSIQNTPAVTVSSGTVTTVTSVTNPVQVIGDVAHDAPAGAVDPILEGCYSSAAAPSGVSTDADAVRAWCLANGARATVITAAGALVGGDAANGLDVDVTRLPALVTGSAVIGKVGIDQTTPGTTNLVQIVGTNANPKINCTNNAFLNMTTATTTEIVPLSGSTIIYICSFSIISNGGTATTVTFVDGTGSNCATSQSSRSSGILLTAATNTVGIARGGGEGMIIKTSTAGDALCVTSSGAATIGIDVSYAQF